MRSNVNTLNLHVLNYICTIKLKHPKNLTYKPKSIKMKKNLLLFVLSIFAGNLFAQWTTITIPNTSTAISNLNSLVDTVYVGFKGDGIFKTIDLGNNWTDISGNLSEKNINKIIPGGGSILFVSTENGPFLTYDQQSYTDNTSTGLGNTDVTHYYLGGDTDDNDFCVGTNGGGFYYGPEVSGPWTAANNGLSGDALSITSMGGYSDGPDTYYMLGTKGGVYYSNDEFASWMDGNNGLSGNQLHVTGAALLSTFSIITTEGGAFFSMNYGQSWDVLFAGTKFNQLHMYPDEFGGINIWFFGEESYYTNDLKNWTQFNTPGEVVCGAITSEDVFIATTNSKEEATIYRQPIESIITSVNEHIDYNKKVAGLQNDPNPFCTTTQLHVSLAQKQKVEIDIVNMFGRKVHTVYSGILEKGDNEITLDGRNLKAGFYTILLKGETETGSLKVIKQ